MSFLDFRSEASDEMQEAFDYYESRRFGLGTRFIDAVMTECHKIVQHPMIGHAIQGGGRRLNLAGFPYYIAYFTRGERIIIVAVAHASRHPDYWKQRFP